MGVGAKVPGSKTWVDRRDAAGQLVNCRAISEMLKALHLFK